jgi:hypothetical protein
VAPSRHAYATPTKRIPRNTNISTTAVVPSSATTNVHGYMNTISMSKARKIIVTAYQRTWYRETACSAGSWPDSFSWSVSARPWLTCVRSCAAHRRHTCRPLPDLRVYYSPSQRLWRPWPAR